VLRISVGVNRDDRVRQSGRFGPIGSAGHQHRTNEHEEEQEQCGRATEEKMIAARDLVARRHRDIASSFSYARYEWRADSDRASR